MSKKHWEVSRKSKDVDSKKLGCSFNRFSAKNLEEEIRKEIEKVFESSEDKKVDKELVEGVKKSWEGVKEVETKIYLTPKQKSNFRKLWRSNKKSNMIKQNETKNCSQKENKVGVGDNQQDLGNLLGDNASSSSLPTKSPKNNIPWIVGGGVLIFIIVIVAIVGMTRKND